jgi:hypothetical protein
MSGSISRAEDSLGSIMELYYTSSLETLIPRTAFTLLKNECLRYPANASAFWGYEIPLDQDAAAADLLICIHQPDSLIKLFEDSPDLFPAGLKSKDAYHGLYDFLVLWHEKKDNTLSEVRNIWFEYDHELLAAKSPLPNFFFAPDRNSSALGNILMISKIWNLLFNTTPSARTFQLYLSCFRALPKGAWIPQVGRMAARKENNLRLFVQDLGPSGILPYLGKINYGHVHDPALHDLLEACYKAAKRVDLDIDILEKTGEKIGLECYFETVNQAIHFIDMLYSLELCTKARWHSGKAYLAQMKFNDKDAHQHFLSHIKLSFDPKRGIKSKIYLGYASAQEARNIIRTRPFNNATI